MGKVLIVVNQNLTNSAGYVIFLNVRKIPYVIWTTRSLMSQISLLTEMNKLGHPKEKLVDNFKFIYCTLHEISNVEFAQQLMATDTEWAKEQK